MTTVGTLTTDLGPGHNSLADNVPLIITTTADDDKGDKLAAAPIEGAGGGQMSFLPCSKLDMEPNPFEQSFSGTAPTGNAGSSSGTGETPKPILPPIASMSGPLASNSGQFGWEEPSLRMGPLSPSMLQGPQDPIMFEKPVTTSTLPISSSFTAGTTAVAVAAPISTIFTSAAGSSMADNSFPMVGLPGGPSSIPPPGPIQTTAPYSSVMYNQQSLSQQPPQHHGARHPHAFSQANGQPPMNGRYMSTQGPGAQPATDNTANGYGNIHMLNQSQAATSTTTTTGATQRETWIKRESMDANMTTNVLHAPPQQQQQQHPSQHHHGHNMAVMGSGMVAAHQLPKNGVEPTFVRSVQQKRMASEDNGHLSDDSRTSKHSTSSNEKPSKKKLSTGGDPMDDEEKRRNFLERNRQAALKCRQRKKQWLSNLQAKVEYLTTDNEHLLTQTAALRDEIIHLKALLLAHKDCPVAQANGVFPDTISGAGSHSHSGSMMSHGRGAPGHSMQGPSGQNMQQQSQQQRGSGAGGARGSLPAQMQTGGARMSMSSTASTSGSMVSNSGMNGQTSVRY